MYKFNQSTLTVKFGDIIDTEASVIVSSDDCYITMGGGVSRAILNAGGSTIMRDAQKQVPVPLGDVVVTTAGEMKQRYVYHCITINRQQKLQMLESRVTEEDIQNYLLQHAVDKCFQLLKSMELKSIAFPCLGAGVAKIPINKVIEQMTDAIARNLSQTNHTICVELYWYDIYKLCSESDIITLFESLASKSALSAYQRKEVIEDEDTYLLSQPKLKIPSRMDMKHRVFVSYSRRNIEEAEYICKVLNDNNILYWIDKEGIYSSSNYKELIVDAIDVSKAVIFISSEDSNASINVIREIGYAVNMNKPILPVIIDDAQYAKSIRLDISDIDQIDFRNTAIGAKKLITSLMYVLNK